MIPIKKKWLETKIALSQTIQNILDLNHKKKYLSFLKKKKAEVVVDKEAALEEELRVLNKIAAQQATMLKKYEAVLEHAE